MDKDRKFNQRTGSSLMFVVIAIAFVGILATIVLRLTMINVNIKSVDRKVKKNFYNAEAVMDLVDISVENLALESMNAAYVEIMQNYTQTAMKTSNQDAMQMKFAYSYLNHLVQKLSNNNASITANYKLTAGAQYRTEVIYDAYRTVLENVNKEYKEITTSKYLPFYPDEDHEEKGMELYFDTSSNGERSLTLKDIYVKYVDSNGNSQEITTDITLIVPHLSFETGNIYPEFTKYSIIGDDEVTIPQGLNSSDISVTGSVYAGVDGLNIKAGKYAMSGSGTRLITRSDVNVQQGATGTFGSTAAPIQIWAENIRTSKLTGGSTNNAKLDIYAENYIHDDLSLDAPYSEVAFRAGKYLGYSFNKHNSDETYAETNSQYSSAILINGKNSALYMGDALSSILLGGRAFISRHYDKGVTAGVTKTDIPLGQAISVKCDQNFYKVASDDLADGFTNPMLLKDYNELIKNGKGTTVIGASDKTPLNSSKYRQMRSYLNKTEPVTKYVYNISSSDDTAALIYFYYNFRSEEKADDYYTKYCDQTEMLNTIKNSNYLKLNGGGDVSGLNIKVSPSLALLTDSNAYSVNQNGEMKDYGSTISDANMSNFTSSSIMYASKYKSYQLTLTDGEWSNYSAEADEKGNAAFDLLDKQSDTIFEALMAKDSSTGTYSFVQEASTRTDAGFSNLKNSDDKLKCKVVQVPLEGGNRNAYAIFVAQLNPSVVSSSAVSVDDIFKYAEAKADCKFSRNDTSNNIVLLVANCSLTVDTNVRGVVISDTIVDFGSGQWQLKAEPEGLQAMISAQKKLEANTTFDKKFLTYFECFKSLNLGTSSNDDESVDISLYLKHENWRKNEDTYVLPTK